MRKILSIHGHSIVIASLNTGHFLGCVGEKLLHAIPGFKWSDECGVRMEDRTIFRGRATRTVHFYVPVVFPPDFLLGTPYLSSVKLIFETAGPAVVETMRVTDSEETLLTESMVAWEGSFTKKIEPPVFIQSNLNIYFWVKFHTTSDFVYKGAIIALESVESQVEQS